ncbi:hypothetical protein [Polaromonas sp.]|uniref:hypothetical protein n=1 Tax=Polaromonas sp. TaxID=1869339 RepID=UPI00182CC401|nr:hypothetical protein [Polaromonas sp.]NMM05708.1 hypothetical protein [Polaromonas sp.]
MSHSRKLAQDAKKARMRRALQELLLTCRVGRPVNYCWVLATYQTAFLVILSMAMAMALAQCLILCSAFAAAAFTAGAPVCADAGEDGQKFFNDEFQMLEM